MPGLLDLSIFFGLTLNSIGWKNDLTDMIDADTVVTLLCARLLA